MMNSHMPYYAPFTQGNDAAMLWLNLDPDYRTTSTTINDWLNFMKPSEVFSQVSAGKRPTDNTNKITFDGNDFLICNVDRVLDTSATGWTVCSRYTEDDWTTNAVMAGDNDSNDSFIKNVGNGITVKATGTSGTQSKGLFLNDPTDLVDSQYYNIAVTCSTDGDLLFYIDGVLQSATPSFANNTYDITMSEVGGKNTNSWPLEGSIQEILVWHKALTPTEAADLNTYLNNKFQ